MTTRNNTQIGELIEEILKTEISKPDIVQRLIQIDNGLSKYKLRPVFRSEWKFIVLRDWDPVDKYWISAIWPDGVEEYTLTEAFEFIEFLKANE